MGVQRALQKPAFIEQVQKQFRAAIIDEFQDTDPIQWEIFRKLFSPKTAIVYLVGDPKQSIYAFRNADLRVYFEAAAVFETRKHLDTNFRSTPPLVEALNALFSEGKEGWMGLEVTSVKSGSSIHFKEDGAPIECFAVNGKPGRQGKFPTSEMLETKIFPYIASEIVSLTNKNIALHEIAVLVKDRFQGRDIVEFLKKRGISANVRRGGSIAETSAYWALKELLAVMLDPSDGSTLRTCLGNPLFGWSEERLISSDLLRAKAKMRSLSALLEEKGFGPFFQELLQTSYSGKPLLEELLYRQELSLYLDLRRLAEFLIEEEMTCALKPEGLLSFLENISACGDHSDFKVSVQEEKGSVAVLTTHMSKGLEFEVVFTLGICARHPSSEHIAIKTERGSLLKTLDLSDPACVQALHDIDAEKMRQLYVALTRAKRRLYIPVLSTDEKKEIPLGEASPLELFFSGREKEIIESLSSFISYKVIEEVPICSLPPASFSGELVFSGPLHLPSYEEKILSFSTLAQKGPMLERIEIPPQAPLSPHTLPPGAETGQSIHALFEKIFKRGLHHPLNQEKIGRLIEEEMVFSLLGPYKSILLSWIVELLTQPLHPLTFSLSEIPSNQLQQEIEFFFQTPAGKMKGFADLFFVFEGKYYFLDWKSNYLGPSDEDYTHENMNSAMLKNDYFLQASIYRDALERYVKLFDNHPFSECFGGAIYIFVRGKGIYHFFPTSFEKR